MQDDDILALQDLRVESGVGKYEATYCHSCVKGSV